MMKMSAPAVEEKRGADVVCQWTLLQGRLSPAFHCGSYTEYSATQLSPLLLDVYVLRDSWLLNTRRATFALQVLPIRFGQRHPVLNWAI